MIERKKLLRGAIAVLVTAASLGGVIEGSSKRASSAEAAELPKSGDVEANPAFYDEWGAFQIRRSPIELEGKTQEIPRCYDSDRNELYPTGKNASEKGKTCVGNECREDRCSIANPTVLFEYYCAVNPYISDYPNAIRFTDIACGMSAGTKGTVCRDGACVPKEQPTPEPTPEPKPQERMIVNVTGTALPGQELRLYSLDLKDSFWQPFRAGDDGSWAVFDAQMDEFGFRVCDSSRATCSEPITGERQWWFDIDLR